MNALAHVMESDDARDSLLADLGDVPVETNPQRVRRRSRDHYPVSPILRRELERAQAELMVSPRDEDEVKAVLKAAWRHRVPVTPRGGGTGLNAQSVPIRGGIGLDLTQMQQVQEIRAGRVRAEAGVLMIDVDEACRSHSGQELRIHPTTRRTASLGGFVACGLGGPGSVTWGLTGAPGNVLSARVMTIEEEPRVLELQGHQLQRVVQAWGTTGVLLELEMPLAAIGRWTELVVTFHSLDAFLAFGDFLARQPGIKKKLVSMLAAPLGSIVLDKLGVQAHEHAALLMVADIGVVPTKDLIAQAGGKVVLERFDTERAPDDKPLYEHSWQHVPVNALKADPSLWHLQAIVPPPLERNLPALAKALDGQALLHLEMVRLLEGLGAVAFPLVRGTEARLATLRSRLYEAGLVALDPHAWTLEAAGLIRPEHLEGKLLADPRGLLNPGKLKSHAPDDAAA